MLETMNLKGKFNKSKIDLVLQRYRMDSYELAKIQRNELEGLNADRREVIK